MRCRKVLYKSIGKMGACSLLTDKYKEKYSTYAGKWGDLPDD